MLRLSLVLAFVVAATAAIAAAWTLEKGRTQTFVTSSFSFGDHSFDGNGKLITVPEYRKFELSASLEYGVRPWLTAIAGAEMREDRVDEIVQPGVIAPVPHTFGSVSGGARARFAQGTMGATAWVASAQATASSAGMDTSGLGDPSEGPAVDGRLLFGMSRTLLGKPVFADVQAGLRHRFREGEADEVHIDLTLGAQVLPRWMVLAQTFSTIEVGGDASYHKVSGSVVRTMTERLKVELGASTTVAGRNALKETGGRLGFWWSF